MNAKPFIDTNVIVYAFTSNDVRREQAEQLVAAGGVVSVQVLNEFVNVSRTKRKRSWDDLLSELQVIDLALDVVPLLPETHRAAIDVASRYGLSFYDGLLVSAARMAGCRTIFSEDLQHGQDLDGLTVLNPFRPA